MRSFFASGLLLAFLLPPVAFAANPRVALETSKGTIVLELLAEDAPASVANFLAYVDSGFYHGTIFHRVISGFMIQGGGLTPDLQNKATREPVRNEAKNGLGNDRGMVAMARKSPKDSATSQFFINVADNNKNCPPTRAGDRCLDHYAETNRGWGYTVFARVIGGMAVVDEIVSVETNSRGGRRDVPVDTVTLLTATRDNPRARIYKGAVTIAEALLRVDHETFADMTYPGLLKDAGGREQYLKILASLHEQLRSSGAAMTLMEVLEVSPPVTAGEEHHAVVGIRQRVTAGERTLEQDSFLIAVSQDGGANWTYVGGSDLPRDKIRSLFPVFNEDLKLPPQSKPRFVQP